MSLFFWQNILCHNFRSRSGLRMSQLSSLILVVCVRMHPKLDFRHTETNTRARVDGRRADFGFRVRTFAIKKSRHARRFPAQPHQLKHDLVSIDAR